MSYLLDTNVVSELRRKRPAPSVTRWLDGVRADELFLSVLVIGELRRGVELLRRKDSGSAERINDWLDELSTRFRDRILPISQPVADRWGRLGVPDPIPAVDALMAATALAHGLTLVTRNVGDFARTGVPLVDPFAD